MDALTNDNYTPDQMIKHLRENGNGWVDNWQQKAHANIYLKPISHAFIGQNSNRRAVVDVDVCVCMRGHSNKFSKIPSFHLRSKLNLFSVSLDSKITFQLSVEQTSSHNSKLACTWYFYFIALCRQMFTFMQVNDLYFNSLYTSFMALNFTIFPNSISF